MEGGLRLLSVLLLLAVTACASTGKDTSATAMATGTPVSGGPEAVAMSPLRVAAAADLALAFEEVASAFSKEQGVNVELIYGSSGQLRDQIASGAPYDVFASANLAYVEDLARRGIVMTDTVRVYALGKLALAWHERNQYTLKELQDLRKIQFKRIVLANPEHAPYGVAAREALQRAGLWSEVEPKIVYSENIRQAVQFIQTGAAEVGIIALSVANSPGIRYVEVDSTLYSVLRQGIGVVSTSRNPQLGSKWIEFLLSSRGQEIMKRYGFGIPN
jgi:molybdate transport system substrate-binding protein